MPYLVVIGPQIKERRNREGGEGAAYIWVMYGAACTKFASYIYVLVHWVMHIG